MGYRSDVKIALKKEAFDKLDLFVRESAKTFYKINTEENKWAKDFMEKGLLHDGSLEETPYDDEIIYALNNVKWNNWYEDVKWIYKGLNNLDSQGYGYIIVEIGEDGASNTESNFDMWDCANDFDEEEPMGGDNIQPLQTKIYTETIFVVE